MNRIIQGLALAAFVSAAHAAPGDAYLVSKQTYADMHANEAKAQQVNAYPSGATPYYLIAKQTYADVHASEMKAQSVSAFPAQSSAAGD